MAPALPSAWRTPASHSDLSIDLSSVHGSDLSSDLSSVHSSASVPPRRQAEPVSRPRPVFPGSGDPAFWAGAHHQAAGVPKYLASLLGREGRGLVAMWIQSRRWPLFCETGVCTRWCRLRVGYQSVLTVTILLSGGLSFGLVIYLPVISQFDCRFENCIGELTSLRRLRLNALHSNVRMD